jgi:hypothetical protein
MPLLSLYSNRYSILQEPDLDIFMRGSFLAITPPK